MKRLTPSKFPGHIDKSESFESWFYEEPHGIEIFSTRYPNRMVGKIPKKILLRAISNIYGIDFEKYTETSKKKQYRLNPDKLLPFTNEKMEVRFERNLNGGYETFRKTPACVHIYFIQDSDIQVWLDSGYLLEVKPREWWELIRDNNLLEPAGDTLRFQDYAEARRYKNEYFSDRDFEIIHVQEIMEEK